jgi:hypothetical protein
MTDASELRLAAATLSQRLADGDARAFDAWFTEHGGEPPVVIWSPKPDQLAMPQLRFLLEHWERLRGSRAMPGRAEISPLDLRPALGFVALIEGQGDGCDFRYRLYGTESAQRTGFDMTGRSLWTFPTEPWLLGFHAAVYRATLLRGAAAVHAAPAGGAQAGAGVAAPGAAACRRGRRAAARARRDRARGAPLRRQRAARPAHALGLARAHAKTICNCE